MISLIPKTSGHHRNHGPGGHVLDPEAAAAVACGQLEPSKLITHRFGFDDFDEAYDVFARSGDTGALKVVLSP
jgi:threonine dehydrogenase-like Zn-dependent dehydrogenase